MIVIEPSKEWKYSLLLLHGLGADGQDLAGLVPLLNNQLPGSLRDHLRVTCPDAHYRKVTLNGGYMMRAWFDIHGLDAAAPVDGDGIRESVDELLTRLETEAGEIGAERLLVGGFSQGGVIALHAALSHPTRLAGAMGLSTWLPAVDNLPAPARHPSLPVFLAHGRQDEVVPVAAAERAAARLRDMGIEDIEQRLYDMPHAIMPEEVADMAAWMARVLPD